MPHFKCEGCRIRLSRPVSPAGGVGDLCPDCGSLLEPVGHLADVVGFRAIRLREGAESDRNERLLARVGDLLAHRSSPS
jgi:hypothetical protein